MARKEQIAGNSSRLAELREASWEIFGSRELRPAKRVFGLRDEALGD